MPILFCHTSRLSCRSEGCVVNSLHKIFAKSIDKYIIISTDIKNFFVKKPFKTMIVFI